MGRRQSAGPLVTIARGLGVLVAPLLLLAATNAAIAQTSSAQVEDIDYAQRWWDVLNGDQMVASLYGDNASAAEDAGARKHYINLDDTVKARVNSAAMEIYGTGMHDSVGAWWETLDCRKMRIAAGDGNTADSSSAFCAHYPGSGAAKILGDTQKAFVDRLGLALLGRSDIGRYPPPPDLDYAMRWWNTLNAEQMVAALHGDMATDAEAAAAKMMYMDLGSTTKYLVNKAAMEIYGDGMHDSVGAWWETLDCRLMRIAAGDGNTADPSSAFCAHYPGSGAAKILGDDEKAFVDKIGMALLGRSDPGAYPPVPHLDHAMRWWNTLNADQMVAALHGDMATDAEAAAAKMMYMDLGSTTKYLVNKAAMEIYGDGTHDSVGAWWETLDCRLMRVAAGDGNTADSSSAFCAHYPGSGAAKILGDAEKAFVDKIGMALLGRSDPGAYPPVPDLDHAMRWWNTLNADQMVASLYGDSASDEQATAAKKMYMDLGASTKYLVNAAAMEIYGDGTHDSVGAWWETLDCRKMRIAAGDGNTADPSSAFCAHYPGSGAAKILGDAEKAFVDKIGMALLGRSDPGAYPPVPHLDHAMRWWNTLNADQMVAALHGDMATDAEAAAAKMMYMDLGSTTKYLVNKAAMEIYGDGSHDSVGAWWETLDCRLMRIAAGDGNTADPSSAFCAHYPGSGAAKILGDAEKAFVDKIGMALLGRSDPGAYPPVPDLDHAMRWWNTLNADQMVAALHGDMATDAEAAAAKMMYMDLGASTKYLVNAAAMEIYGDGSHDSVGAWWETLDCRKMRIAAGDGNTADPSSAFCAHYPGSGAAKILGDNEKAFVDQIGIALLGRADAGVYPTPEDIDYAMRWWNALNAEQMVAALHGDMATDAEAAAAKMMYMDLGSTTKYLVNKAAMEIYGDGMHDSVGAWWETLDCRKMRIAAGDGNTADSSSAFCAHYPGSGAAKILGDAEKAFVDKIGIALLGRSDAGVYPTPENIDYAMRWWNALNAEQMVAALHGDMATDAQAAAAKMMYMDLGSTTKYLVNKAAMEIYGDGMHDSVGAWWETLDCRKMRIAAGDGNTADSSSAFCAHYPGSGAAKILGDDEKAFVDQIGIALLGRSDAGVYPTPEDIDYAMRWWNALNAEQMVAALHGDMATDAQAAAAKMMYMDLGSTTKYLVNKAAMEIYGDGMHDSVGAWWETLDCRKMRIAAGDGNTADSSSAFCAHYPGSGAAKILGDDEKAFVDQIGIALLGRSDAGVYPTPEDIDYAMRWWNALNAEQMVAALHGDMASDEQAAAAKMMYMDLGSTTKYLVNKAAMEIYGDGMHDSVGAWWETLDCRLMRIAAGDGNTADSSSAFCAHYPGSGAAKILGDEEKAFVDQIGIALLGRTDAGVYPTPEDIDYAMRWWNALNAEQMVAALHGDMATDAEAAAAKMMYMDLGSTTKYLVNKAAMEIYGDGMHDSVGAWWETLDCRKMRIAAGDGNAADSSSAFCAHYPGSGAAKILGDDEKAFVDEIGIALLGRADAGVYPTPPDIDYAMRWWNALNADQMVAALHGDMATDAEAAAAKMMYMDLGSTAKYLVNKAAMEIYGDGMHDSVGAWWETLDCRLMRVAAGDGNTADSSSPFCAHYPGSGADKILGDDEKAFVDKIGLALLARSEVGVFPPPGVSVGDARTIEAPGATLEFAVTLDKAGSSALSVDWETEDGTATAGSDYTQASGSLTFAAGETSKTVTVTVLEDQDDEPDETLTLKLSNVNGGTISDAGGSGVIGNTSPPPVAWLARFGRTVAEHLIDGVSDRLNNRRKFGKTGADGNLAGLRLGGQSQASQASEAEADGISTNQLGDANLWAFEDEFAREQSNALRGWDSRRALSATNFSLTAGDAESGEFALWARGAHSTFEGEDDNLTVEGGVTTGMLGADWHRGKLTVGLTLSMSEGDGDYSRSVGAGEIESTMSAITPYLGYQVSDNFSMWGAYSRGEGDLEIDLGHGAPLETDIEMQMFAAGARNTLMTGSDGFELSLVGDAMGMSAESEAVTGLAAADADVTRVRVGLEGAWMTRYEDGGIIARKLEAAARHDSGDAEEGLGAEISGGIAWTTSRMVFEIEGRALVAHEDEAFNEYGGSAYAAYDPSPGTPTGPTLSLRQSWGISTASGVDQLFSAQEIGDYGVMADSERLDLMFDWGMRLHGDRMIGAPILKYGVVNQGQRYALGWRLVGSGWARMPMQLEFEVMRRERQDFDAEHGLGLRFRFGR